MDPSNSSLVAHSTEGPRAPSRLPTARGTLGQWLLSHVGTHSSQYSPSSWVSLTLALGSKVLVVLISPRMPRNFPVPPVRVMTPANVVFREPSEPPTDCVVPS